MGSIVELSKSDENWQRYCKLKNRFLNVSTAKVKLDYLDCTFYVSLISTVESMFFVSLFFFMFLFGIIWLISHQQPFRSVAFSYVCPPKLRPELTPSSVATVSSGSSSNLPLSSRINLRQMASDHSQASSSRQHSNAATANSSSISLNKSYSFTSRPLKHHSFISEVPDVRHMERALLGLLEDFHSGKLKAFGKGLQINELFLLKPARHQHIPNLLKLFTLFIVLIFLLKHI